MLFWANTTWIRFEASRMVLSCSCLNRIAASLSIFNIPQTSVQCNEFATPLVDSFAGFDDLEDEDHDGDDNEDRRLSWDPSDCIDETD